MQRSVRVAAAPCKGIEEVIQQREHQCDEKTVPHRPHQRIGFGPEPEFAGGVEREEPDEPEQGSHEEVRESVLGCHEMRGSKGLQSEESGGADHRNTSGGKIGILSQSSKRFGESSDRTQKKAPPKGGAEIEGVPIRDWG